LAAWEARTCRRRASKLRFDDSEGRLVPTRAEAAEAEAARLKERVAELEGQRKSGEDAGH
jgi:hypothetical protein